MHNILIMALNLHIMDLGIQQWGNRLKPIVMELTFNQDKDIFEKNM